MDRYWCQVGCIVRWKGQRRRLGHVARVSCRRLNVEPLETRRMPAVMTVTDLYDNTLANLAGDGLLSLREAVEAISTGTNVDGIAPTSGQYGTDDEIVFLPSLFDPGPRTIGLVAGQLELAREVVLTGPGQNLLTLDAQQNSRVLQISQVEGDFTVATLTLTGGRTLGDNPDAFTSTYSGGAIRSLTSGDLTIDRSTITGNSTGGTYAAGGGVFASGNLTLTGSTISGNQTAGSMADGGGLYAYGNVAITSSTISGNRTTGSLAHGGGMYVVGGVTLTQSTISGNSTTGSESQGGGIYAPHEVTIMQSTITDNQALDAGGGIWNAFGPVVLDGSIVAGNMAGGSDWDLQLGTEPLSVQYSLIGDHRGTTLAEAQVPDANGNLVGSQAGGGAIDPVLGPLADHGGPTLTHALLAGSPALNGGDPAFDPNAWTPPLDYDQRGGPFDRVTFGRIDMGARELDTGSGEISADFDADGDVDGVDFLAWQRGFGTQFDAVAADGDATGDGAVRAGDLAAWQSMYGEAVPLGEISLSSSHALPAEVGALAVLASAAWYVPRFQPTENMSWGDADFATFSQPFASGLPASRGGVAHATGGVSTCRETEQRAVSRASLAADQSAGQLERGPGGDEIIGQRMIGHAVADAVFAQFGEAQEFGL